MHLTCASQSHIDRLFKEEQMLFFFFILHRHLCVPRAWPCRLQGRGGTSELGGVTLGAAALARPVADIPGLCPGQAKPHLSYLSWPCPSSPNAVQALCLCVSLALPCVPSV